MEDDMYPITDPEIYQLKPGKIVYIKKIPDTSPGGDAIDTLGWKVVNVNGRTKESKERSLASDYDENGLTMPPNGVHVFRPLSIFRETDKARQSLQKLFSLVEDGPKHANNRGYKGDIVWKDKRFQMRPLLRDHAANNIFFITDKGQPQPDYRAVMQHVRAYDSELHDFIQKHAEFCLRCMGSGDEAYERMQLQLVHYSPGGGILPHIDSINAFDETIGPIFTVNMNQQKKSFDLFPTLKPIGTPAVRLKTNLGQITMMDGESRLTRSHAIPSGTQGHAFTIAFKFPCQPQNAGDSSGGYCHILRTHIPQNLQAEYRPAPTSYYDHEMHDLSHDYEKTDATEWDETWQLRGPAQDHHTQPPKDGNNSPFRREHHAEPDGDGFTPVHHRTRPPQDARQGHAQPQKRGSDRFHRDHFGGTREVVLNVCYGGFGLSDRVKELYQVATMEMIRPDGWDIDSDVRRDDPVLLSIIKKVGLDESSTMGTQLKIVEIPDDVPDDGWTIQDYDGMEWVAEKHRTWR